MTQPDPERTYPHPPRPNDRPRNNAAVRVELYRFLSYQKAVRQYHVISWQLNACHSKPCQVCDRFEHEMSGVCDLIRSFGGRPRL